MQSALRGNKECMFLFFSSRLGVLGSILLSLALTGLVILLFAVL